MVPIGTNGQSTLGSVASFEGEHSDTGCLISQLPRSESMEVTNDPRFFSNSVITKRLAAFQTVSVVSVLMVNLSVKQMFILEKDMDLTKARGVAQYVGFILMSTVFLMDLFTVIVVVQQLFMTFRLLTTGPTGFEVAKSFYLNPNIVTMRHSAVKGFLFSLPLFAASSCLMVFVKFDKQGNSLLAIPPVAFLLVFSMLLCFVNWKHSHVFLERYMLAKQHSEPLLMHADQMSMRARLGNLDV